MILADEVVQCLKACIISRKGGVPINELNAEYKELVGNDVPFEKLGHKSLEQFVRSVSELRLDAAGIITAMPSDRTRHLQQLIQKQKEPTKNKKAKKFTKRYEPYGPPHMGPHNSYPQQQRWGPPPRYQNIQHTFQRQPPPYHKHQNPPYLGRKPQPYQNMHFPPPPPYYQNVHQYYKGGGPLDLRNVLNVRHEAQQIYRNTDGCFYEDYTDNVNTNDWGAYYLGYQVIGDNHMLDMIGTRPSRLCSPGMTIKRALLSVRQYGCGENVLIALGTSDILKGISGEEMIMDMHQLVQTVCNTNAFAVLCTLPMVPAVSDYPIAVNAINIFNKWVRSRVHGAFVVDLDACFMNGSRFKNEYFQKPVRWSKFGYAAVQSKLYSSLKFR